MRSVTFLLFMLALAVGCSNLDEEDGGTARLEILNDTVVSVTVIVDESELGTVLRDSSEGWFIIPGEHRVELLSSDGARFPSRERLVVIPSGTSYSWRLN